MGYYFLDMRQLLLIMINCAFLVTAFSQKHDSIIYKCNSRADADDHTILVASTNPPKLMTDISEIEQKLNTNIRFPLLPQDSILKFFVKIIVNCDGSAKYSIMENPYHPIADKYIFQDIIDKLKSLCEWQPAKGKLSLTGRGIKKINGKLVKINIYTQYLDRFGLTFTCLIQNGKLMITYWDGNPGKPTKKK